MSLNIFVVFTLIMLWQYYRSGFEKTSCINAIFAGMWVLFSIEYFVTNDYIVYHTGFYDESIQTIWEPLYRLLLRLFAPLGFTVFNSAVAAFEMFTLCFMFKRFCPKHYMWVGILFFILDVSNMMSYMCFKRQFLAQMVAIWTLYFMIDSQNRFRYAWAAFAFVCAVNIHTSAYAALAYFILPLFRLRIGKIGMSVVGLLFIGSLSFQRAGYSELLDTALTLVQGKDSDRYGSYITDIEDEETEDFAAGKAEIAFNMFYLLLLLYYNRSISRTYFWLFLLSIFSILLRIMLVGDLYRLSFYFSIVNFFTIPILLVQLGQQPSSLLRRAVYLIFLTSMIVIPAKSYYNAMSGSKVSYITARFKKYNTIFDEAPDLTEFQFDGTREIN